MEQKKKNVLMLALIYLVIFVAYNLVVFLVFKDFNDIFWISYSFMVLAYLIHIGCAFSIAKNTDVKALLKSNIKDSDVRKLAYNWKKRGI